MISIEDLSQSSDIADICDAFKNLSENDLTPLFICTSNMIARTPLYESVPVECKCGKEKLDGIEKTLHSLVKMVKSNNVAKQETAKKQTDEGGIFPRTTLGQTIPVTVIEKEVGESNGNVGNEWTKVNNRSRHRNHLQSNSRNVEAGRNKTPLVVTRVKLGTLGLQIRQWLANKDIEICDVNLLTKRDDASFLTFKITVKNEDVEKLQDPSVCPKEWTIREYKEKENVPGKRNRQKKKQCSETVNNSSIKCTYWTTEW